MRQTRLTRDLRVVWEPPPPRSGEAAAHDRRRGIDSLIEFLNTETQLAFHAVIPHGNILKCISELLMRCASHVPVTVDPTGISFVACDPASGRLIHVVLQAPDLVDFCFLRDHPLRCTLPRRGPASARAWRRTAAASTRSATS